MGADKSLARPGRKQATFPAFYGTWWSITTFTRAHHLSLPFPNQSIPLPITLLTGAACLLPGRAKDLSAPGILRFLITCVKLSKFKPVPPTHTPTIKLVMLFHVISRPKIRGCVP